MEKWEYLISRNIGQEQLNTLGAVGWELVAVIDNKTFKDSTDPSFYLKRKKEFKFNTPTK